MVPRVATGGKGDLPAEAPSNRGGGQLGVVGLIASSRETVKLVNLDDVGVGAGDDHSRSMAPTTIFIACANRLKRAEWSGVSFDDLESLHKTGERRTQERAR